MQLRSPQRRSCARARRPGRARLARDRRPADGARARRVHRSSTARTCRWTPTPGWPPPSPPARPAPAPCWSPRPWRTAHPGEHEGFPGHACRSGTRRCGCCSSSWDGRRRAGRGGWCSSTATAATSRRSSRPSACCATRAATPPGSPARPAATPTRAAPRRRCCSRWRPRSSAAIAVAGNTGPARELLPAMRARRGGGRQPERRAGRPGPGLGGGGRAPAGVDDRGTDAPPSPAGPPTPPAA